MPIDLPSSSKVLKKRDYTHVVADDHLSDDDEGQNRDHLSRANEIKEDIEIGFEDEFEDEFEPEVNQLNEDEGNEDGGSMEEMDMIEDEHQDEDDQCETFLPGSDLLKDGEVLDYDCTAYDMIHFMHMSEPCLSFDIIQDDLGFQRKNYPHTIYAVSGSQSLQYDRNNISVMKMTKLHRTKYDQGGNEEELDDSEELDDPDVDIDEDAILEVSSIPHNGGINRIRAMPQKTNIIAAMCENYHVEIFDFAHHILHLDLPYPKPLSNWPILYEYKGHEKEGFALDWSPVVPGRMATGDGDGEIRIWNMTQAGHWSVSPSTKSSSSLHHDSSTEDLQWSPTEGDVLASCSVDRSIRIWDIRTPKCVLHERKKHQSDINIIHWNRVVGNLLVSGGDDGYFKVWDMKSFKAPLYSFDWHKKPISSIEWCPNEPSVLIVSSEDDSISIWDLSLTKNPDESTTFPPQLLFVHQGQQSIKEVHWHKQITDVIISTAQDGFNVWKPNLDDINE